MACAIDTITRSVEPYTLGGLRMATRIQFFSEGFRQILLSEGTHKLVEETAQEIADKANANNTRGGDGFKATTQVGGYGGGRWIAFVSASDKKASEAEAEDKALTRGLT